jgi:O-antigen ligase
MEITQVVLVICLIALAGLIFKIPEIGLVLCLVVGSLFKGIIQPELGAIDITVYVFAVTYGSIFIRCSMEKKLLLPNTRINMGFFLLIAILLASILYTPLPEQGFEILLRFIFLTVSIMYATFIWCTNIYRIKRLLVIFCSIVLVYGTASFIWTFLLQGEFHGGVRAAFPQTPPLGVAKLLAAGILTAFILRVFENNISKRAAIDLLIIAGTIELVALNSRGPLIAFFVGAFSLFLLYSMREKKRLLPLIPIMLIILLSAFILLPTQFTLRYLSLASLESSSIAARLDMWRFVAEHFSDWFFTGAGLFGFAYYFYPEQTQFDIWGAYPHNIFLDVFTSSGFFGLLVFIWLIWSFVYKGIIISNTRQQSFHILGLATVVPLITFLAAGMFSMSIIGTRTLWLFGGLILSLEALRWKDSSKKADLTLEIQK